MTRDRVDWIPKRLDELGSIGRGKSRHRPRNDPRLYGGPYPFIQTADVMAADPYIVDHSQTYSQLGLEQSKLWPPNTLCMTIAGANTAKTAILKFEACFPDSIVGFLPDPTKADLHFVKYSLDTMRTRFLDVSRGATQDNLILDKLLSFPIPTPPIGTQRLISRVLSAYDDLIENCERRIRVLDEMARAIYHEWFVLFRYPDHEKTPLVDSPLGRIPKGWNVGSAGSVACETRRSVPKGSLNGGPARYVGLEHIPRRTLALVAWEETEDLGSNKLRFERGEILFGKIRPYFHKVSVAHFGGVCSADTFVISPKEPAFGAFTTCLVSSDEFVAHASATANGAKMPRANWDVMMEFPIVVPPPSILRLFSGLVDGLLLNQGALVSQSVNLRKTRDLLLPRLLSGELSVEGAA